MKYGRFLLTLGWVGILSACTSAPLSFNPQESKALNIARAAGIDAKLKDVEMPKDTVNNITDSAGFGFAMAASGYHAPIPGFSPNQMAAMNFTAWLLGPQADSARNSLFAWVPMTEAQEKPVDYLADLLMDAASKAAKDMGYDPIKKIAKGKSGSDKTSSSVFLTNGNKNHCQNDEYASNCMINFALRTPKKEKNSPAFIGSSEENWFFDPSDNVYSRFNFLKDNHGLNELELLVHTSKYLPKWVYFYIAPKKVRFNEKEYVKIPVIINQGKVLYFVKPNA